MQLTLVVPGLLDFAQAEPARGDAQGDALARLLATGVPAAAHDGATAVACAALGIAKQRDWPVAPLLASAANLDPGNAFWLLAEPVMLVVGQQDVQLAAVVDDLSADEAMELLTTFNAHFAGDGLHFFAATPARWLIAATATQELVTHPADDALGAPIFPFLPGGPDAARWRRWQSEMQMLLFSHPVTAKREHEGRAEVNGVWLSGGGVRADVPATPHIASVYADAALQRDLARACGLAAAPAPSSFTAWIDAGPRSPSLVWLQEFEANDGSAALAALTRDWADPLRAALDAHAIDALDVVLSGRGRAAWFTPRPRSLIGRWRARLAAARLSTLLAAAGR
ncbi:MAG: hypothetical protein ABI900_02100 [Betaproteobacteria bacterium]